MKKLLLLLFLALSIPSFSQEEDEDTGYNFYDSLYQEGETPPPLDLKRVSDEEKGAYGFSQEPMVVGKAFRIAESVLRGVSLKTIEEERQEKILENFFWARGLKERDEDFAITLGRTGARIFDVVSWVAGLILIYMLMKNRIQKVIKASVNFPKDRTRKVIKAVANF